jgi:hypothetical protein
METEKPGRSSGDNSKKHCFKTLKLCEKQNKVSGRKDGLKGRWRFQPRVALFE